MDAKVSRLQRHKSEDVAKVQDQLDQIAWILDNAFRIPGINWRFGIEPLIGLIPGAGDIVSGAIGLLLLIRAFQFKLPKIVIARMLLNSGLDLTIGAIPFIGDLFDFVYKSNTRNMKLFHQYAEGPAESTTRHWIFIACVLGLFGAILFGIFLFFIFLVRLMLGSA
jgi:hypothetical protein